MHRTSRRRRLQYRRRSKSMPSMSYAHRPGTSRRILVLLCSVSLAGSVLGAACKKQPTGFILPPNNPPAMDSLIASPSTLGAGESTMVRAYATDPDGDRLVYDWFTDSRLKINGALPWDNSLFNTDSSWRGVHNADLPNRINDTAWVRVRARDGKGGETSLRVEILLAGPTPAIPSTERGIR